MNINTPFSASFLSKTIVHPLAKFIYQAILNNYNDKEVTYRMIEVLFERFEEYEKELNDIREHGLKYNIPKVEVSFKESTEEIKRLMRTTMFDIKYQGYNDQYGTWSDISEQEYIQVTGRFRYIRMIYVDKAKPPTAT